MRGWNEELGLLLLPRGSPPHHPTATGLGRGPRGTPRPPGTLRRRLSPGQALAPHRGWGMACGNGASGNQRDLLGYTLNPPHKRGLFVGTGCRWLSHTCLASRAWRIKDNWFSPDRKHQEC